MPEYPGGKVAFRKFVDAHIRVPEAAIQNHIEGTVYLTAEIDDNGNITDVVVEKGLGYGCDEEAVRLVRMLHFGGVSNKGIRLKTRKKFKIKFNRDTPDSSLCNPDAGDRKIPEQTEIRYFLKKEGIGKNASENRVYDYRITLDKDPEN